ncbi:unnamed protein product [Urochloa humidicola]
MADLTKGAVDGLLGLLATAIGDEARLLGGLPGNMQFIKDEMDSMNGFLTHLTKTEREHDDQIRAWMKQVRDVAYIAEDCVERYVRDIAPHEPDGPCGGHLCLGALVAMAHLDTIAFLICHPKKYMLRRQLATQLLELKARVDDVGARRMRYGVEVPPPSSSSGVSKVEDGAAEEEKKMAFLRQLQELEQGSNFADSSRPTPQEMEAASFISKAIDLLPNNNHVVHIRSRAEQVVGGTWRKCSSSHHPAPDADETAFRCIKMLLCGLYAYPYKSKDSLELKRLMNKFVTPHPTKPHRPALPLPRGEHAYTNLNKEEEEEAAEPEEIKRQAMVFCYSLLSTNQKSCLQY